MVLSVKLFVGLRKIYVYTVMWTFCEIFKDIDIIFMLFKDAFYS